MSKEIGDRIRHARQRLRMTQEQLAQELDVSQRTVGNWERGETVPMNRMGAIECVLGIDLTGQARRPQGVDLSAVSDYQLLDEIAARLRRGRTEDPDAQAAPMTQADYSAVAYRPGRGPRPGDDEVIRNAEKEAWRVVRGEEPQR